VELEMGKIESFQDVLETISKRSTREWVYLSSTGPWNLRSESTTLESDEVPPELEDEPDAGTPQFAVDHGLKQVVPVATLQDIVSNALEQNPDATMDDLFNAFEHYYRKDAFINF
jgi:hypothetical protein